MLSKNVGILETTELVRIFVEDTIHIRRLASMSTVLPRRFGRNCLNRLKKLEKARVDKVFALAPQRESARCQEG